MSLLGTTVLSHGVGLGTAFLAESRNEDYRAHSIQLVLLKRSRLPAHAVGTAVFPASMRERDRRVPEKRVNSRGGQVATTYAFVFGRDWTSSSYLDLETR